LKKASKIVFSLIMFLLIILNTTIVNASSTKINAPKNVKASVSGTKDAKVTWSKVKGAKKYTIYRATSKKGKYKKVGTSKTTSFVNKNLSRGNTYFYKVVANSSKSNSKKSSYAKVKILTKSQVLKKIRNKLKDKKWVKKNVEIKDLEGYSQTLYFGKIKNKELVAIEAVSQEAGCVQMFLVGYKDGKVVSASQKNDAMLYYHGGPYIDLNTGIARITNMTQGWEYNEFYKVKNVKFKMLGTYESTEYMMNDNLFYKINDKKVSRSKYYSEVSKYSKYDCNSLQIKGGHKLTNSNIDKYIK